MKRYCQTLTLVDDEEMIAKYVEAHQHVWPEIIAGQREVGIQLPDVPDYATNNGHMYYLVCPSSTSARASWPG